MSVMTDDATGEAAASSTIVDSSVPPAEDAAKFDHLFIEVQTASAIETGDGIAVDQTDGPESYGPESFRAATIALSIRDVLELGTESIAGIDALVIHGEQGDVIQLANEAGYSWSRTQLTDMPDGYEAYQVDSVSVHDAAIDGVQHDMPVYVLVQQDLTVVIAAA